MVPYNIPEYYHQATKDYPQAHSRSLVFNILSLYRIFDVDKRSANISKVFVLLLEAIRNFDYIPCRKPKIYNN